MLNENDLNRYARQVIIPNFDEEGQEKLLTKMSHCRRWRSWLSSCVICFCSRIWKHRNMG